MDEITHKIISYIRDGFQCTMRGFFSFHPDSDPSEVEQFFLSLRKKGYLGQDGLIFYITEAGDKKFPKPRPFSDSMMKYRKKRCPRCKKKRRLLRNNQIGEHWGPIENWDYVCTFCVEGEAKER